MDFKLIYTFPRWRLSDFLTHRHVHFFSIAQKNTLSHTHTHTRLVMKNKKRMEFRPVRLKCFPPFFLFRNFFVCVYIHVVCVCVCVSDSRIYYSFFIF